jgi:hypothetical protein
MYVPTKAPTDPAALARYVEEQFQLIAQAFARGHARQLDVLYVEPAKLYDGLIAVADGTEWDPGSGAGVYVRVAGNWEKL